MSILTQVWLIFHCVSPTVLLLVGWVMAVLQAALRSDILSMPWCVSGPSQLWALERKDKFYG